MSKAQAISRILSELGLPSSYEDYVLQTIGRLGCGEKIDALTFRGLKEVIKNELR